MPTNDKIIQALTPLEDEFKLAFTVDCVIFGYDNDGLKVLTIECSMDPFKGLPSLIGDFITPNEDAYEAAKRILEFCTGNSEIYLEEVKSFSRPDRHPFGRVITIAFYSLVQISNTELTDVANKHLEWIPINEVKKMAFDHKEILDTCLDQLRKSLREKPIGFELLPRKFSIKQLQKLYEVVLDIELDKRNFRRKLLALEVLIDLDEMQKDVSHRPAKLYKFDHQAFLSKESNGIKFML